MPDWRLDVSKSGIESDRVKDVHVTPTTEKAIVGAGFHITATPRTGSNKYHRYYEADPLEPGKKPDSLVFKYKRETGDKTLIGPLVISKVEKAAIELFKEKAKGDDSLYKFKEQKPLKDEDFPPLGKSKK